MDTQVVVTLITGVFGAVITPCIAQVVIPLVRKALKLDGTEVFPGIRPKKPLPIFLQAGAGGIIGVLLGYLVVSPVALSPCPPFAPTSVTITSPASGGSVPRLVIVQGTACHIPQDKELWLLIVPEGATGYYPQAGPIVISSDGRWSTSAYMGLDDPVDIGRGFVLIAALADQKGSAAIRPYFAQSGQEFKGIEPLPQGIQLMTQIQVIRK